MGSERRKYGEGGEQIQGLASKSKKKNLMDRGKREVGKESPEGGPKKTNLLQIQNPESKRSKKKTVGGRGISAALEKL